MNARAQTPHLHLILWGVLLLLALPAVSTYAAAAPASTHSPSKAADGSHTPVILSVAEREEAKDGYLLLHKDIYFRDEAGDATVLANKLVAMDPGGGIFINISDDPITAPAAEQREVGLVTSSLGCPYTLLDPFSVTVEDRVRDQAGNLSEPAVVTFSCAAGKHAYTVFMIARIVAGLALLVAAGLYFHAHPARTKPVLLSGLLLMCSLLVVGLAHMALHEGGHALSDLPRLTAKGLALYVHPFAFSGFSRPVFEWDNTLSHSAGALAGVLGALLISLPLWKRRSVAILPIVMLFPWAALGDGLYIAQVTGDFRNIMNITGLPPAVFIVVGLLIALTGVLLLFSLLPLFGLMPEDKSVMLILPATTFLWGLLSMAVAYAFVPHSPFAVRWHLAGEILHTANQNIMMTAIGLLLAALYISVYRWAYRKLPASLRTAQASLSWKDLQAPGFLAALSMSVGLMVVIH